MKKALGLLVFIFLNGMEWNGMEWNGMEWNGMEWNGMEWNGMEWNGLCLQPYATHQVGGLITYKCLGGFTYEITVMDYTNTYPANSADRDTMRVWFGDGQNALLYRQNGLPNYLIPGDVTPNGEPLCNYDYSKATPTPLNGARKLNIYQTTHTFVGPGSYRMYMEDPDRMANISNMSYSVGLAYYMYTTLIINPDVPVCINSPLLRNPPVCQYGCTGQCYTYNPGAYIPDLPPGTDDSISYSLGRSLTLNPNPPYQIEMCPGYDNEGATVDRVTGTLTWCKPDSTGIYNFVITMITYQRAYTSLGGFTTKIIVPVDTVELELEVLIQGSCADPVVTSKDTCIVAGGSIAFTYTATVSNGYPLYLSAAGEPFSLSPPATLSYYGPHISPLTTTFNWTTNCNEVRDNPYQVVIKATEKEVDLGSLTNPPDTNYYSGYGTSLITVVGPAPKNLMAEASGTTVCLHWNPSTCSRDNGYNIYRQNGCSTWKHGYCETGVPAYTGYTLIATNYGLNDTTYCDSNNGAGLSPGGSYSYIVDGTFPLPDASQSYASNDTCISIKLGVPIITNVSVTKTDPAHGEMFIRWMKPLLDSNGLDTNQYPPPYKYVLQHATGINSLNFSTIATYTTSVFKTAIDTTFMDTGLNTQANTYNYKISFYSGSTPVGSSGTASSIYLSVQREDQSMKLGWTAKVPWTNDTFYVYREDPLPALQVYNFIGKTTKTNYIDTGLHNGSQYCYYVESYSQYTGSAPIAYPLYDSSETICGVPEDTIAPCAPPISIGAKCTLYEDSVIWSNPDRLCPRANKVWSYQILYTPVEGGNMTVIATISRANLQDTVFVNDNLTSIAGCYAVIAIDSAGQKSPLNTVCVDNCPIYRLPNVFTPNGDGIDDFFIPLEPYRYVKSIDINIYNRWGQIVFHTTNPNINWNGNVNNSGGECPAGVYYYICTVNEIRLAGIVPLTLKGFIQIIR